MRAAERNNYKRGRFRRRARRLYKRRLIFVDESAVNTAMTRRYGRAPRGERAHDSAPRNYGPHTSVVGRYPIPPTAEDYNPNNATIVCPVGVISPAGSKSLWIRLTSNSARLTPGRARPDLSCSSGWRGRGRSARPHADEARFQADADLNEEVVSGLLRSHPDLDFQTAEEAELRGLPDPEVLARAADDSRILVTHDRRTMPAHFTDFIRQKECPGVIIISPPEWSAHIGLAPVPIIITARRKRAG